MIVFYSLDFYTFMRDLETEKRREHTQYVKIYKIPKIVYLLQYLLTKKRNLASTKFLNSVHVYLKLHKDP